MKTKAEYEKYKKSVEGFFKREGISNLSQIQDKDGYCEPHFSGVPCECCGGMLGGDRYDCNSYNPKTKGIQEYTVCTDCVYYAEYGQLDDMTMSEIRGIKQWNNQ